MKIYNSTQKTIELLENKSYTCHKQVQDIYRCSKSHCRDIHFRDEEIPVFMVGGWFFTDLEEAVKTSRREWRE